jgi:hypothetical protein
LLSSGNLLSLISCPPFEMLRFIKKTSVDFKPEISRLACSPPGKVAGPMHSLQFAVAKGPSVWL